MSVYTSLQRADRCGWWPSLIRDCFSTSIIQLKPHCTPHAFDWNPHKCCLNPNFHHLQNSTGLKIKYLFHHWNPNVWWHYTTVDPKQLGGFKKCFEEQGQAHEKALRTPHSTLFGSQGGNGTWGDNEREGGHTIQAGDTIQHRHTCGETMRDKTSHITQHRHTCGETMGNNGRQGEARPREGGHTIQHRRTCVETIGNKGR